MNQSFAGKRCLITGGALGIGKCLVESFAAAGASVRFIDSDGAAREKTEKEFQQKGWDVSSMTGDAANPQDLERFARWAGSGGADVLVNNACISRRGLLSGCSYEDFDYVLRLGVAAPYYLTMLLQKDFRPGACVVNISSSRAFQSQPDTESYTAAKGGISALTHAMAVSLAGKVRVNCVSPGWIDTGAYHDPSYRPDYSAGDTDQHPSGRVGEPGDIARTVLFLCDPRNSFINGENITVDGGMTHQMIYHGDCGWKLER